MSKAKYINLLDDHGTDSLEFLIEAVADDMTNPTQRIKIAMWIGDQTLKMIMQDREAPPTPPAVNITFEKPNHQD